MAEIKSTLDIIMERTKNLTMSDEEKASLRRKESEGKVRGWIQKYQNGTIGFDKLKLDIEKKAEEDPEILQILKTQLLDSLRLTGDNIVVLRLLEDIVGINTESIEKIIQSFKRRIDTLRTSSTEALGEELKKRKIYGSAVIPNPNHGADWQNSIFEAESDLRKQLESLVK
ncbi:MAG: hypothetical protein ACXU9G_10590 [Syntrophales bacterium]